MSGTAEGSARDQVTVRAGGQTGAAAPEPDQDATGAGGIAAGCRVMTLEGEIPVEFLSPGDRIVTRAGMRRLASVSSRLYSGPAIRLAEGAFGHDRPQTGITLPAATRLNLRDWRAKAMFGTSEGKAPLSRLTDGEFVSGLRVRGLRVFTLAFESAEVIYVEGLEIACPSQAEAASQEVADAAPPRRRRTAFARA